MKEPAYNMEDLKKYWEWQYLNMKSRAEKAEKERDELKANTQRAFMAGYSDGIQAHKAGQWGPVDGHRRYKKWENDAE